MKSVKHLLPDLLDAYPLLLYQGKTLIKRLALAYQSSQALTGMPSEERARVYTVI